MLGRIVVPALTGSEGPPIFGPPADPSKLRRHIGTMPGLLSDEEIAAFLEGLGSANDGARPAPEEIVRQFVALIRDLGRKR